MSGESPSPAEVVEETKTGTVKFCGSGLLPEMEVAIHLLIGSSDTRLIYLNNLIFTYFFLHYYLLNVNDKNITGVITLSVNIDWNLSSCITSKPFKIRWIRSGSQPYRKIMLSNVLYPVFYEYRKLQS